MGSRGDNEDGGERQPSRRVRSAPPYSDDACGRPPSVTAALGRARGRAAQLVFRADHVRLSTQICHRTDGPHPAGSIHEADRRSVAE